MGGAGFGSTLRLFLFQHHYTSGIPERSPFFPQIVSIITFHNQHISLAEKKGAKVGGGEGMGGKLSYCEERVGKV